MKTLQQQFDEKTRSHAVRAAAGCGLLAIAAMLASCGSAPPLIEPSVNAEPIPAVDPVETHLNGNDYVCYRTASIYHILGMPPREHLEQVIVYGDGRASIEIRGNDARKSRGEEINGQGRLTPEETVAVFTSVLDNDLFELLELQPREDATLNQSRLRLDDEEFFRTLGGERTTLRVCLHRRRGTHVFSDESRIAPEDRARQARLLERLDAVRQLVHARVAEAAARSLP